MGSGIGKGNVAKKSTRYLDIMLVLYKHDLEGLARMSAPMDEYSFEAKKIDAFLNSSSYLKHKTFEDKLKALTFNVRVVFQAAFGSSRRKPEYPEAELIFVAYDILINIGEKDDC